MWQHLITSFIVEYMTAESEPQYQEPIQVGESASGIIYLHPDGHVEDYFVGEGSFSDVVNGPSEEGAALYARLRETETAKRLLGVTAPTSDQEAASNMFSALFAGHNKAAALGLIQDLSGEQPSGPEGLN